MGMIIALLGVYFSINKDWNFITLYDSNKEIIVPEFCWW